MSVVAIHQTSKPHEIAKRLNAQYRAIEKSSEEMGRDLVLLKKTKPPGIEWGVYLKELGIEFGRDYADRLIRRVEGREKKPIPKPAPGPSPEPVIDIIEEPTPAPTPAPADPAEKLRAAVLKIAGLESEIEELKTENADLRRQLEVFKKPVRCEFVEDDGGREAAGYGGDAGDCVARSIAIATKKPYGEVFEALKAEHAKYVKRHPRSYEAKSYEAKSVGWHREPIHHGCGEKVYTPYLKSIGWQYTRFTERTYLRVGALPMGRLIVDVNQHFTALIDGVIHDTHDAGQQGRLSIMGYWSQAATSMAEAKKAEAGAVSADNDVDAEASAEAMKAKFAEADDGLDIRECLRRDRGQP